MSEEEHLIQMFIALNDPNIQDLSEITSQILEFLDNPESIFLLLQISSSHNDRRVRHAAMVFSRKYLMSISKQVSLKVSEPSLEAGQLEYLLPLKEGLLNMLIEEPEIALKISICDIIESYAEIIISISTWPEISHFAMNLIQDPNQTLIALHLLLRIYMTIPEDEKKAFFLPYAELSLNSLLSESDDIRIQAIDCLTDVLFEHIDGNEEEEGEGDILEIPNLIETLKNACERAIQYDNDDEMSRIFGNLFRCIFYDRYSQFDDELPSFCEFALNVIQNPEISLDTKIKCHQIIDEGPRVIPEYFAENLVSYLRTSIELSVSVCENAPEMLDYQFNGEFLSYLAQYSSDVDEFYSTIIECVKELFESDSPASIPVALFSLSCIVNDCADSILEEPELIVDVTMKGLQSEEPTIMISANALLQSLIEDSSSCLSNYIDDIVKIYAPNLFNLSFLQTLSDLLRTADHQPTELIPLIHLLLGMLNQQEDSDDNFKSDIIKCINSSICHAEVDESLYQEIAPTLIEIVEQDHSLITDVFDCFGSLLVTSPTSIMNDIQSIMEIVFTNGEQSVGCANTLLSFIENYPISMEPFYENTIQLCQSILSNDYNEFIQNTRIDFEEDANDDDDDNENDGKGSEFSKKAAFLGKQRGAAIKMIAYLNPNEDYINIVINMLKSISMIEQSDACISIDISATTLFKTKSDPSLILSTLFVQLYEQENVAVAADFVQAINALISAYPSHYIIENSEEISKLILASINGELKCFSESNADEKIMQPIFLLFDHFVETVGENFSDMLPYFQERLFELTKGQARNLRGYAALILTRISIVLQNADLLQLSFSSILMNARLKHMFLRINIFNAFRLALRNCEMWQGNQQLVELAGQIYNSIQPPLIEILGSVISGNNESKDLFEAAAALWARCMIVYDWSDFQDIRPDLVFQKVETVLDNDNGKCVDLASLLLAFSTKEDAWSQVESVAVKIAIRVFAQNEWDFQTTPQDVAEFCKNVLLGSDEDVAGVIASCVGSNERVQKTITDRLS